MRLYIKTSEVEAQTHPFHPGQPRVIDLSDGKIIQLMHVEGLDAPEASVATQDRTGEDGEILMANSTTFNNRTIVITGALVPPIEEHRCFLTNLFNAKRDDLQLHYVTDFRQLYTDVVVKSVEVDPFANPETIQITLYAREPFMRGSDNGGSETPSFNESADFFISKNVNHTLYESHYQSTGTLCRGVYCLNDSVSVNADEPADMIGTISFRGYAFKSIAFFVQGNWPINPEDTDYQVQGSNMIKIDAPNKLYSSFSSFEIEFGKDDNGYYIKENGKKRYSQSDSEFRIYGYRPKVPSTGYIERDTVLVQLDLYDYDPGMYENFWQVSFNAQKMYYGG